MGKHKKEDEDVLKLKNIINVLSEIVMEEILRDYEEDLELERECA